MIVKDQTKTLECSQYTASVPGIGCSLRWCSNRWPVKRWKQMPAVTRPARPRRCSAFARDTHTVSKLSMLRAESYLERETQPSLVKVHSPLQWNPRKKTAWNVMKKWLEEGWPLVRGNFTCSEKEISLSTCSLKRGVVSHNSGLSSGVLYKVQCAELINRQGSKGHT